MKILQADYDYEIAQEFADQISDIDFLGVPIFDGPSLWNLLLRFAFNLLVCWIIIHFFYYRKSHRRDYYFTFIIFSATIFLLLFLLQNLALEIGFALGLFAIFGMIRYRTSTVPIREMTYLFLIIGISIINGFGMTTSYTALIVTNILLILLTWLLEGLGISRSLATKLIIYDRIALIHPDRREELIKDLKERTGLDIDHIQIGHINYLKDIAFIKVYYHSTDSEDNDIDMVTKIKQQ